MFAPKTLMITFRYRLRPTRDQVVTLEQHVEICRQLYNRLLAELNRARDEGHICPQCGFTTDRDINASLVIRKRGTGRAPSPVELASLPRLARASAGKEAGTLINSHYIVIS